MKYPSGNYSTGCLPARQQGATLIVALLILLAMTIIGTSSMSTLTLEERMIKNIRDENVAFQAAESGLAECEANLADNNPALSESDYHEQGDALGNMTGSFSHWWHDPGVWSDMGIEYASSVTTTVDSQGRGGVAAEPVCIREHIGLAPDDLSFESRSKRIGAEMYTVTVKGTGAEDSTETTVQSVFFARYK